MNLRVPTLTREWIRARLALNRSARAHGDVATATRLLTEGRLEPFASGDFGPVPSSGIPYDRGAGAPGVAVTPIAAAVLVPLVEHPSGYTVLLTQRTADLKKHAGQVAFPGGRMEPEDADAEACALREAAEETGLEPRQVEVLGRLPPYLTITGYQVTPVVAAVTPPLHLRPDPVEVAAIFEVPLAHFLDAANHRRVERDYNGLKRAYYAMPYGDRYIWGATAAMLVNLYDALVLPETSEAG